MVYKDTVDADTSGVPIPLLQPAQNCQRSTTVFVDTGTSQPRGAQKGYEWLEHNCGAGGCYTHIQTPNKRACMFSNDTAFHSDHAIIGASSFHPGGVNCTFIDGSVRFVKASVSPQVWWGIATKAGGEVISADSF